MRAVFAGAEDQRLALAVGRSLDAAEEHDVVAAGHVGLLAALERGERPEQQRAAAKTWSMHDVVELVVAAPGEVLRQGELPRAEHVDGEVAGGLEARQR